MIRHRVVARGGRVERAHAPAGERRRREQRLGHARGARRCGDAGPQQVAGVRRSHPARPLRAVEREHVGAEFLAPERALEVAAQAIGARRRGCAPRRRARAPRASSAAARRAAYTYPCTSHSAIGPSASAPSAWKTESCESFQPCCDEAAAGAPRVLDEAVAVDVAVVVDPVERALDVRPQRLDRVAVAGALPVLGAPASRTAASRRRCRSSGRTAPRRAPPSRRRATSCRILPGSASRSASRVVACVAARNRSTPRASSGSRHSTSSAVMMPSRPNGVLNHGTPAYGYGPCGGVGDHHLQVGGRAIEPRVEPLVARRQLRDVAMTLFAPRPPRGRVRRRDRAAEADRRRRTRRVSSIVVASSGSSRSLNSARDAGQPLRRRRQLDARRAHAIVEPLVRQRDRAVLDHRAPQLAAMRALHAADLEHVDEVRAEHHRELELDRPARVVVHAKPRVPRGPPQKARRGDVYRIAREPTAGELGDVGVREIDDQHAVVAHGRAEQQRPPAIERELERRQEPRAIVVDAELADPRLPDRSGRVEHAETFAVLDDAGALIRPRARGQDVVVLVLVIDLLHAPRWPGGRRPGSHAPCGRS